MFLNNRRIASDEYEIMASLAALGGRRPHLLPGLADCQNHHRWRDIRPGHEQQHDDVSFVASVETTSFSADTLDIFKYLEQNKGLSSSLYLVTLGAGTEPFTGIAELINSAYSVALA